ncbi:MAG TPA: hypothetical protein VIG52_07120 [Methyloceanibacter sp.]|jgi:hypothetical protein
MRGARVAVFLLGAGLLTHFVSLGFAAECQVIAATHGGNWKGEALATSRALAARSASVMQKKMGWRSVTITAYQVKPDPFWKIVRPQGVPEGVIVGSFITSRTHTTCFTGVVVPYVCTSGAKICGN